MNLLFLLINLGLIADPIIVPHADVTLAPEDIIEIRAELSA